MIHTFEINKLLNEKKVIKVLTEHYEMKEIHGMLDRIKRQGGVIELSLSISGIILASIAYANNEYYRIYLRVEPQSLIKGRKTIDVFECSTNSIARLRGTLDDAIRSLSSLLPQSDRWAVSRIDFTKNLITKYVKECVALAKKGKDPYHYKDSINMTGSSYRKSKSVILNYYNKFDHISKKIDTTSFDAHLLEEARNVYRIEVQCLNHNKLKHIREKFKLPRESNLYDYLCPNIADWAFYSYYDKVIGRADYYSLAEATKVVESTEWNKRKKENIKNWLKLIAQARSISKARRQFVAGTTLVGGNTVVKGSSNTFRNYERDCRDIGVNPVTIPRDWGINYIPNPINSIG